MPQDTDDTALPPRLGDRVADIISGFVGIVVCRALWIHGCVRYAVQNEKVPKDGAFQEPLFFDTEQLRVVKRGAVETPTTKAEALLAAVGSQDDIWSRVGPGGPTREKGAKRRKDK